MMVFLWESLVFLVGFLGPRASALASGTPLEMERGAWYLCQYMGPPVHGPVGNGKGAPPVGTVCVPQMDPTEALVPPSKEME